MKQIVRKELLEKRKAMTKEQVKHLSSQIMNRILEQLDIMNSDTIALYYPFQNEVDVLPLIEHLLNKQKNVVLPKVTGKTTMDFFSIQTLNDVKLSKFGLLEPSTNDLINKEEIDWMLIPGVGFNSQCFRLGYGAGYYDRYLETHTFKTVGICFDFQVIDSFEPNHYDIPLDYVISENRLLQRHNGDYSPNLNKDK